jgi:hypothetical protein
VADDPLRWARSRVPEVLARAEAEAVATLRDLIVKAALDDVKRPVPAVGREKTDADPKPPEAELEREQGDALWIYGVLAAGAPAPADCSGVDDAHPVEVVRAGELAALVSRVPLAEFGADPLRRNLNDIAWLERIARAHERVLEQALGMTTVVPLRLCTLYESEANVAQMLEGDPYGFREVLDLLEGREEWGVKLLVDREQVARHARAGSREAAELEAELAGRSGGGAYMLRRRLDRQTHEAADSLAASIADDVHGHLREATTDAVTRPPQNRDLSGHEGEMLLNAAYLVDAGRVDDLHDLVAELQERHRAVGARLELTGPWPPYNFVPSGSNAAIA